MSIINSDVKFYQSQRMTDFSDGGGRMSATEIIDNAMNNVFSDRSDLDGIIGRLSLRKLYLAIHTANTDPFLGPFVFLSDPPADPNVSVCIFSTGSTTDVRDDAKNYVEAYRLIGVKSQFILYGDHFAGQRTIQVYCRTDIASPDISDVLELSVELTGYAPNQQFVAVQEVASRTTVTFTDDGGDFVRDVLLIKITTALAFTFAGKQDPERFSRPAVPSPTVVRFTQVADSAKYYGQAPCTVAPAIGDLTVKIDSPYIPIVPSTQAETPLVDLLAGLGSQSFIPSSAAAALTFSSTLSAAANVTVQRYFGSPYVPGTLAITVGSVALRDDGSGNVVAVVPTDLGWSGEANYATGMFSIARDVGFTASVSMTATAAGMIAAQSYTQAIAVTAGNRDISYIYQLKGQASPGTVVADYLALGKWIRLTDDGRGHLTGNPGEGSGTVNYATGSVALTLGALPDVDSAIIASWGVDLRARNSSGEITIPTITYRQQLAHPGIVAASLTMTWVSATVTKTATAAATGVITGDATGNIDMSTGAVEFTTTNALDNGEQFHYAYTYIDPSKVHSEVFTPTPAAHAISIALAHAPVAAHSVVLTWTNTVPTGSLAQGPVQVIRTVVDNGTTGFNGAITGTNSIDLASGAIVLTVDA